MLLGLGGIARLEAASVRSGHVGDALIFPLWSVNNLDTLIAIESFTSVTTLHRVRLRDDAGNDVLQFTVCLTPGASWTAAIFRDGPLTRVASSSTLLVNGSAAPFDTTVAGNPLMGYFEVIGLRSDLNPAVCTDPSLGGDVPNRAVTGRAYYVNPLQSPILAYGVNALALEDFATNKIADGTVLGNNDVAVALIAQGALGATTIASRYFVDPAFGAVTQVVLTFPTGPASGGCPSCLVPSNLTFLPFTEPGTPLAPFNRSTSGLLVNVFTATSGDIASPSGILAATDTSGPTPLPVTGFVVQTNTLLSPIFNVLFPLAFE